MVGLLQCSDPIEKLSEPNPEPNPDDDQLQVVSLSLSRTFVTKGKAVNVNCGHWHLWMQCAGCGVQPMSEGS